MTFTNVVKAVARWFSQPDPTCTNMYNEPANHPNAGIGGYAGYHWGSLIGGNINIQRRSSIGKTPVMEDVTVVSGTHEPKHGHNGKWKNTGF
ncbi:hypothetical protein EC988_005267 [Linderina pennispora]|nr:hypothetical protein EC988_005267 [Linderina pennispora]